MKLLFNILLSLLSLQAMNAQLQINELMQSNIDCIMDDLNEFPDSWVELYNPNSSAVNLAEYSIGLTNNANEAYKLPQKMVNGKGFITIYCDKENKDLHTSFRLEAGKDGAIYLFRNGLVVDKLEGMAKQPYPNIAYGRKTEGSDSWGYQLNASPNAKNTGIAKGILPEVVFSIEGYVKEKNENIKFTLGFNEETPEGTVIVYSTDGKEPTVNSLVYKSELSFTSTKVIKAKAICNGYISPRATTHSFIIMERPVTLPVISISTDPKYLNDTNIGILAEGNGEKKNYENNWRRPVNIEYFDNNGTACAINQLCEARVLGGASRGSKIKSLALYANKRFGKKRFKYEFFPDQRPEQTNYKSLALRNAGNDFDYLYMRDAVIQRSMAKYTDLDWQAWQPAIYYINGQYIGIINIRERSNEDNIFTNYDELEDIDMFENWWERKAGTWDYMNKFKEFYTENGHTWNEYSEWMDLEEYINLMIMNMFFNNLDFPGNNIVMWRPRTEDGKWRFIAKDTDFGLGLYGVSADYNTIEWMYDNKYDSNHSWANKSDHTLLFRRLMNDKDFQREFIDRASIYMGDFMNHENIWQNVWSPMYNTIKTEYPKHRELINKWWPNYDNELSTAQIWLKERPNYFYKYLGNYYNLGAPNEMHIEIDKPELIEEGFNLTFNGIKLHTNEFNGKFYQNRNVTLSANETENTKLLGWEVMKINNNSTVNTSLINENEYSFVMPSCQQYKITAHIGNKADAINDISDNNIENVAEYYDLQGIRLNNIKKGINIVRGKDGKVYKVKN